jgi:hypothetical protein
MKAKILKCKPLGNASKISKSFIAILSIIYLQVRITWPLFISNSIRSIIGAYS